MTVYLIYYKFIIRLRTRNIRYPCDPISSANRPGLLISAFFIPPKRKERARERERVLFPVHVMYCDTSGEGVVLLLRYIETERDNLVLRLRLQIK